MDGYMDEWVFSPVPLHLTAVLKLTAVASGVVVILATEARRYLAMSDDGRLYSSVSDLIISRHSDTHTRSFKILIKPPCPPPPTSADRDG